MGGIGERLEPRPTLPQCGIVLVNPGVAVATADVFRARRGAWSSRATLPAGWANSVAMAHDLGPLHNDLEPAAVTLQPVIADVLAALAALPGCLLARMSGSGATCFGLFADRADSRTRCERDATARLVVLGRFAAARMSDFTLPGTRPMHGQPDGA